jgi:hypothetical protein
MSTYNHLSRLKLAQSMKVLFALWEYGRISQYLNMRLIWPPPGLSRHKERWFHHLICELSFPTHIWWEKGVCRQWVKIWNPPSVSSSVAFHGWHTQLLFLGAGWALNLNLCNLTEVLPPTGRSYLSWKLSVACSLLKRGGHTFPPLQVGSWLYLRFERRTASMMNCLVSPDVIAWHECHAFNQDVFCL